MENFPATLFTQVNGRQETSLPILNGRLRKIGTGREIIRQMERELKSPEHRRYDRMMRMRRILLPSENDRVRRGGWLAGRNRTTGCCSVPTDLNLPADIVPVLPDLYRIEVLLLLLCLSRWYYEHAIEVPEAPGRTVRKRTFVTVDENVCFTLNAGSFDVKRDRVFSD